MSQSVLCPICGHHYNSDIFKACPKVFLHEKMKEKANAFDKLAELTPEKQEFALKNKRSERSEQGISMR